MDRWRSRLDRLERQLLPPAPDPLYLIWECPAHPGRYTYCVVGGPDEEAEGPHICAPWEALPE